MKEIVNLLGTGEKWWICGLLTCNLSLRNKTRKQTSGQSNLLTSITSCEKKLEVKWKKTKTKMIIIIKRGERKEKKRD